jgi:hypothetical protein
MQRAILSLTAVLSVALAAPLYACSVPVFRYALEHWPPDAYEVFVLHRGGLSDKHAETLRRLQPETLDESPPANLHVQLVDLDAAQDPARELAALPEEPAILPWIVVRSPARVASAVPVWSGELNEANVERLLTSPLRETIARRLVEGESVVWVFLESGDARADDAAFETLSSELERLQGTLKLPELDPADATELSVAPEALKLSFSAVRLARDNPAERLLVEMLLSVEPDLRDPELAGQPMAFPVFGRGRALYALVGAGIVPGTIEDASTFLVGACQCTVKADNPGVDLLMSVDWDGLVQPSLPLDTAAPPLIGLAGFSGDEPSATGTASETLEPVTSAATPAAVDVVQAPVEQASAASAAAAVIESPPPVSAGTDSHLARNVLVVLGLLGAVVVVATFLFLPRQR